MTFDNELQQDIKDDIVDDFDKNTITYFTKKLASNIVYHILTPTEYPETNPDGVAYMYNVEGWEEPLAAFIRFKHEMRTCQGSKLCEFATSELHNQTHQCVVDINSDLMMQISHPVIWRLLLLHKLYLAARETPCNFRKNKQLCEGKPVLRHLSC
ncbi:hypothetical protein C2G38_2166449 [Gigaspora rosea]|uniref:Uncharacterized protein n=1 Tax=Gigaspora rosea TaxID=44941 RepID=A0A397VU03_9GLOM|nr:hypothetical protein C2G38_2166449 [Gigaspora rosea]